jgi:hypothetical protein
LSYGLLFHNSLKRFTIVPYMRYRKAVSPVITATLLVALSLFLGVWIGQQYQEIAFSNVKVKVLEFASIYCTRDVSVENTSWQISILVINRGTESFNLTSVFVNGKPVDVYGLIHGDSLVNGTLIGTSLTEDGVVLTSGESFNAHVWIGDQLFSSGTEIEIHFNDINSVTLKRSVQLT